MRVLFNFDGSLKSLELLKEEYVLGNVGENAFSY